MRSMFLLSAVALTLAACSSEAPAPDEAPLDAATAAVPVDAMASASPAPEASASPSPTPTASASPTPTPSASPTSSPSPGAVPVAAAAPATFARCAVCHNADKGGADKLGPNLWGVAGSKAGQGSFAFSEAMKASGVTWNDESLDKYLENPRLFIPGNRMAFPGLKDAAKRGEVIAYLKTRR